MRDDEEFGGWGHSRHSHMGHSGWQSRGFGLKYWVLSIVSREPSTGSMIMEKIENMSMGHWRPSPGHIYPLLDSLTKEGYLGLDIRDGKKYYSITEKGKEILEGSWFPWNRMRAWTGFNGLDESVDTLEMLTDYITDNKDKVAQKEEMRKRIKTIAERLLSI